MEISWVCGSGREQKSVNLIFLALALNLYLMLSLEHRENDYVFGQ